jgi:hypothetical protein
MRCRPHPMDGQRVDRKDNQDDQEPVPPEKTKFACFKRLVVGSTNIPAPFLSAYGYQNPYRQEQDNKREEYQYLYNHCLVFKKYAEIVVPSALFCGVKKASLHSRFIINIFD